MIKLIVFDLGGVVVKYDWTIANNSFAKYTNLSPDQVMERLIKSSINKDFELGRISAPDFCKQITNLLEAKMDMKTFAEIWCNIFSQNYSLVRLLRHMKGKYTLYLLSNSNELQFNFIKEKFPIIEGFDKLILSHKIGMRKPDKEIFDYVLKVSGLEAHEIIYIDDKKEFIDKAAEYGFNTIHYTSVAELEEYLKSMEVEVEPQSL